MYWQISDILARVKVFNPAIILYSAVAISVAMDRVISLFSAHSLFKILFMHISRILVLFSCFGIVFLAKDSSITDLSLDSIVNAISWTSSAKHHFSMPFAFAMLLIIFIIFILTIPQSDNILWRLCMLQFAPAFGVLFANNVMAVIIYLEVLSLTSAYIILQYGKDNSHKISLIYMLMHIFGGMLMISGATYYLSLHGCGNGMQISIANALSNIFLLGLLVNVGIPPFCYTITEGYNSVKLPAQLALLATSTKAILFVLLSIFYGYELLHYIGVIMLCYIALCIISESRPRLLAIYLLLTHIAINLCCISVNNANIGIVIVIDILESMLTMACLFTSIVIIEDICTFAGCNVKNLSALRHSTQGCIALALLIIGLYAMSGMPGMLGGIGSLALHNAGYISGMQNYSINFGHVIATCIIGKFLFGCINFLDEEVKNNKLSHKTCHISLWCSIFILSVILICGIAIAEMSFSNHAYDLKFFSIVWTWSYFFKKLVLLITIVLIATFLMPRIRTNAEHGSGFELFCSMAAIAIVNVKYILYNYLRLMVCKLVFYIKRCTYSVERYMRNISHFAMILTFDGDSRAINSAVAFLMVLLIFLFSIV